MVEYVIERAGSAHFKFTGDVEGFFCDFFIIGQNPGLLVVIGVYIHIDACGGDKGDKIHKGRGGVFYGFRAVVAQGNRWAVAVGRRFDVGVIG